MITGPHHSPLTILLEIAVGISSLLCLGYFIGGLNAVYIAKALEGSGSTSLPDISRRLGNGFFYFTIAGIFLAVFLVGAYAVVPRAQEPCR